METVINPDQTGFIANRFIGDNTRLLYDTINHCEMENKEGLIIVLDFAKAFDTIEWSYIYSCLEMFGYGDKFITMVKLLHNDSTSVVENNGNFSTNIRLSRGCRQGIRYPRISSYFVRKFYHTVLIRDCGDIKGIEVHGTEIFISQYEDDTTLFLEGTLEAIKRLMSILRWFKNVSGLGINVDKTKAVKLGATRDRSLYWEGRYGMEWTNKFTVLGINYDINDMGEIASTNIEKKIIDIKKLIRLWQARKLSPYGKVTVIKSLFLSGITHLLLSLPSPKRSLFEEINSIFKKFLWNNKPPKFRKEIIEAEIIDSGLKLHNLEKFDLALKLGWAKSYLEATRSGQSSPTFGEYMMLSPLDPTNLRLSKKSYTIHSGSISSKVLMLYSKQIYLSKWI